MIHQHHRQTDRWTTCHRAVKKLLILFCYSCIWLADNSLRVLGLLCKSKFNYQTHSSIYHDGDSLSTSQMGWIFRLSVKVVCTDEQSCIKYSTSKYQ